MAREIAVIIPTRNRADILEVSLVHLYHSLIDVNAEVIIVNDGDNDVYRIKNNFPQVNLIESHGKGVASARNTGSNEASAELLLFMDDDMWMTPEAIRGIIKFHRECNETALNVNWIYPVDLQDKLITSSFGRYLVKHKFTSLKGWNKDSPVWRDDERFETTGITSQNLSIRKETFCFVGGYNETFPHAGFEDYEFSKRLIEKNVRIYIEPRLMTFHNEIDRLGLISWMDRRQRGSETRRVAVELGYHELRLDYTILRRLIFPCIYIVKPFLTWVSSNGITNRFKQLDSFSFLVFDSLFATAIYKGYFTRKSKQN